jgi:hypothetical protein
LGEFREFIDIDFEVVGIGILFAEFDYFRSDDLGLLAVFKENVSHLVCSAEKEH